MPESDFVTASGSWSRVTLSGPSAPGSRDVSRRVPDVQPAYSRGPEGVLPPSGPSVPGSRDVSRRFPDVPPGGPVGVLSL